MGGGHEWWFSGQRIAPGDTMTTVQEMHGYRMTETNFAGPTVFHRGDSHFTNQRGEPVALQRSRAIRYIAFEARNNAVLLDEDETDWCDEDLARIFQERKAYVEAIRSLGHSRRSWESVNQGEQLATKVIGPHSHVSFTTAWHALNVNLWGDVMQTTNIVGKRDLALKPEMTAFTENAECDPEFADGACYGAARGHLFDKCAGGSACRVRMGTAPRWVRRSSITSHRGRVNGGSWRTLLRSIGSRQTSAMSPTCVAPLRVRASPPSPDTVRSASTTS